MPHPLNEAHIGLVRATSKVAAELGLTGPDRATAVMMFSLPGVFGAPARCSVRASAPDPAATVRAIDGRSLKDAMAHWAQNELPNLAPGVKVTAQAELDAWLSKTPEGRVVVKLRNHEAAKEKKAMDLALYEFVAGEPFPEPPPRVPTRAELPPLPSLPPGVPPPLEWLYLRDKHVAAAAQEDSDAAKALLGIPPVPPTDAEVAAQIRAEESMTSDERAQMKMDAISSLVAQSAAGGETS